MDAFKYIIIGGGMTADSASRGIRQLDPAGSIAVFSNEPYPPYSRPPLSKGLWKGKPVDRIWRNTEARYGVNLFLNTPISAIHPAEKTVRSVEGKSFYYEKLLIATGGSPRRLPCHDPGVIYLNTYEAYLKLREKTEQGDHFIVIGAGFTGMEISAALAGMGKKVTIIFPSPLIGRRIFPADLAQAITDNFIEKGITLLNSTRVSDIQSKKDKYLVITADGRHLHATGVIAGIGSAPNIALAGSAGLAVDDKGIVVDECLRTSDPDIYAAGDVASFFNSFLGHRLRAEHEDNSNVQGRTAGHNMAGQIEPYTYLPFFYSDIFDSGYEAIGDIDADLDTVSDWITPYRQGTVYYLRNNKICGVLLWNLRRRLDEARKLIERQETVSRDELKGLITPTVF